jgi:hypothetical protein
LRRFESVRRKAPGAFSRNPERNARRIRPPLILRRYQGVRRIAPGALSRNPERFCAKDLRFAFDLGWRLGGWFSPSLPRRLLVPDGFSRAVAGTRTAILAPKTCPVSENENNEIDWLLQGL